MSSSKEVALPWPDRGLSPNSRMHWAKKMRLARAYRHTCKVRTLNAIRAGKWDVARLRAAVDAGLPVSVTLEFYPPDRRRRDDDNVVAAIKPGRDGLADALKIDDCHFRIRPVLCRDEPVPGGAVRVVIEDGTES